MAARLPRQAIEVRLGDGRQGPVADPFAAGDGRQARALGKRRGHRRIDRVAARRPRHRGAGEHQRHRVQPLDPGHATHAQDEASGEAARILGDQILDVVPVDHRREGRGDTAALRGARARVRREQLVPARGRIWLGPHAQALRGPAGKGSHARA